MKAFRQVLSGLRIEVAQSIRKLRESWREHATAKETMDRYSLETGIVWRTLA